MRQVVIFVGVPAAELGRPIGTPSTDTSRMEIPFDLIEPWVLVDDPRPLEHELARELRRDSALHGKKARAVARRIDCDDVLFLADGQLAVVHLTWLGKTDPSPGWPYTTHFDDWEAWMNECMVPDAEEYGE